METGMEPARRVSTRDIAAAAGFSSATVSRALRGDPRISAETRQRVREAAASLGYVPSPLVSALMQQIRERRVEGGAQVALLIDGWWRPPHADEDGATLPPNYRRTLRGARERLLALGYGTETHYFGNRGQSARELQRILHARGIQGLLILPTARPVELRELPDLTRFASATFSLTAAAAPIHRATTNHLRNSHMVMEKLLALGHRRIGITLHPGVDERTGHALLCGLAGYPLFTGAEGVELRVRTATDPDCSEEIARWIREHGLTALVTSYEVAWRLREAGLRFPADLSLVHLDATVGREQEGEDYAGIQQRSDLVGSAAADLLVGQLTRNESGLPDHPKLVSTLGEWMEGATLGEA
jgi:DNA-binding LacI/PurR family transcriptional regulator